MTTSDSFSYMDENKANTMSSTSQLVPHISVPMQGLSPPGVQVIHPQQPNYIVETSFSWCHFVMNILCFLCSCCNPCSVVFTVLGMLHASKAYASYGAKQFEKARSQNHIAMIFWIIALVFTVICLIMFFTMMQWIFSILQSIFSVGNIVRNTADTIDDSING